MKSRKFYEEQAIAHYKEIRNAIVDCKDFYDVEKVFEGHPYFEIRNAEEATEDNFGYFDVMTEDEEFTIFINENGKLYLHSHVEIFNEGDQIADLYITDYSGDNCGINDAIWYTPDTYEIPVNITFSGKVFVSANDLSDAIKIVEENFKAILSHCTHNECDEITDWDICRHSDRTEVAKDSL